MSLVESFNPVIGRSPRVLILGSMPGITSLQQQQYYAHPRNAFWPIMAEIFAVRWRDDYAERIQQLQSLPLILWDTLKRCQREGSLDSAIVKDRLQANDIAGLLDRYSSIRLIAFNGAAAEKYFNQAVADSLNQAGRVDRVRLPSTSPAHASKNLLQKLAEWRVIQAYL